MAHEWFYTRDGKSRSGPVSTDQLRALARSGQLQPSDMVKRSDMPKWLSAAKVHGLFQESGPVLAHSMQAISPVGTTPADVPQPTSLEDPRSIEQQAPATDAQKSGFLGSLLNVWHSWSRRKKVLVVSGAVVLFFMMFGKSPKRNSAQPPKFSDSEYSFDFSTLDYSVPEVDFSQGPSGQKLVRRRGPTDPETKWPVTESGFEQNGSFVRHGQRTLWNSINRDTDLEGNQRFGEDFWFNGKLHGKQTAWHNGSRPKLESSFVAGLEHGKRTEWYPNGKKQAEFLIYKDQEHGPYKKWHENGQPAEEGIYKDKKQHGKRVIWDDAGRIKSEEYFIEGKLHGQQIEYHKNGKVFKQYTAIKGLAQGQYAEWHDDGQKKALEGNYNNGRKDGEWLGWHPTGEKALEGAFDADKWTGTQQEWYSPSLGGNLKAVVAFAKSAKTSETAYYPATTVGPGPAPIGAGHKMYEMVNGSVTAYNVDGSVNRR